MNTKWGLFLGLAVSLVFGAGCQTQGAKLQEQRHKELQEKIGGLEAQLGTLNNQVADLKQAPTLTPLPPEPATLTPADEIQAIARSQKPVTHSGRNSGSKSGLAAKHIRVNVSVKSVQAALQKAGFNPGKVDGVCGEKTVAAIRAFQAKEGLKVDGVVGSATWAKLSAR